MTTETVSDNTVTQLILHSGLAPIDAKLILRHILNLSATELILAHDRLLTSKQLSQFHELCVKRKNGVPLHYLTGSREFYSRAFSITSDTLVPRPETELMVEKAIELAKSGMRILDLGTGCGCIALSIALECKGVQVIAIDNSAQALAIARNNAVGFEAPVEFIISNWYDSVQGTFDIIISNPPYIANDDPHLAALAYEPQTALTDFADGLNHLRHIIINAPNYLNDMGYLLVEHGYNQGAAVRGLFKLAGFNSINTELDYASCERYTYGYKL